MNETRDKAGDTANLDARQRLFQAAPGGKIWRVEQALEIDEGGGGEES